MDRSREGFAVEPGLQAQRRIELSAFVIATYLRGTKIQANGEVIGKAHRQYLHRPTA